MCLACRAPTDGSRCICCDERHLRADDAIVEVLREMLNLF